MQAHERGREGRARVGGRGAVVEHGCRKGEKVYVDVEKEMAICKNEER